MSDFLQTMAAASAERAALVPTKFSSADFDKPLLPLARQGFGVIAEIKERSPAEGDLRTTGNDRLTQTQHYVAGGAAAISVLTEPSRFDGALLHLEAVVAAAPQTPVMRKDFLVDPVQVSEARKAGRQRRPVDCRNADRWALARHARACLGARPVCAARVFRQR